ncbi:hypothetical protein RB195_005176 [Necator americanus]|uniref:G-protein coupled receptors family 1 profile domain-containing protein n=1 Tax=Necator americanus TaxID=51031 RepID=A0ABR1BNE1_NECAM
MSSECERGPLTTSTVDYWVQHVVFPCQVFILTLVIYDIARNATSVKSRIVAKPNLLVLALLNLLVFGTMLPQSLGSFSWFFEAESFRRFFHYSKIPINALSNLISAMEIFITLAICVECYLRSKSSSLVKCFVPSVRYVTFLVGAFIMSAGLTGYHFLLYELETGYRCNGTKLVVRIKLNTDLFTPTAIKFCNIVQAVLVIVIPCICMILVNRRHANLIRSNVFPISFSECRELFSEESHLQSRRKTILMCLPTLTICFVFSHMLSFLPFLYDLIPSLYEWGFPNVITVMNSVLMSGKLAALAISSHMCQELGRLGVSTY